MDHLEHAKTLYRKRHDHAGTISADDHASLSMSITRMIGTCLVQQGGVASFQYLPFIQVIKKTVGAQRFQSDHAAMAFATLEKYLLLLLAQPWKREFWLLKVKTSQVLCGGRTPSFCAVCTLDSCVTVNTYIHSENRFVLPSL